VRARRTELAVMKVLGFTPNMVLILILGEALILGIVSGVISAVGTKLVINEVYNGVKIPIAFFPAFKVPDTAPLWGLAIGAATSLAGSLVPAWFARNVKVSEVFSKIA
jgi:putative ABC transport system permease protein